MWETFSKNYVYKVIVLTRLDGSFRTKGAVWDRNKAGGTGGGDSFNVRLKLVGKVCTVGPGSSLVLRPLAADFVDWYWWCLLWDDVVNRLWGDEAADDEAVCMDLKQIHWIAQTDIIIFFQTNFFVNWRQLIYVN